MMTDKWYTCAMRKLQLAIQGWLRRLLGVPSTEEVQQANENLRRSLESRLTDRSNQLVKAEAEMQKVATDMTLALYDAVEKIMAEIEVAKKEKKIDE